MLRRLALLLVVLACCVGPSIAQEVVTLTSPTSAGTVSTWKPTLFLIEQAPDNTFRVVVELTDNLGNRIRDEHTGASALALVSALNTANLSSNSLLKRLLTHVQGEGRIAAGSVTGTPY